MKKNRPYSISISSFPFILCAIISENFSRRKREAEENGISTKSTNFGRKSNEFPSQLCRDTQYASPQV